jgi:hypothetical protein
MRCYLGEWANSPIASVYVDLTPERIDYLYRLRLAFQHNHQRNPTLQEMVYVDDTPLFLSEDQIVGDFYFTAADGEELTIYQTDSYVQLADDTPEPTDLETPMTITYLVVDAYGFEWRSRDDTTEDEVDTYQISWDQLQRLRTKKTEAQS